MTKMLIAATKGPCVKFSVKGSAPNAGWHIDKAGASLEESTNKTPSDYLSDWYTASYRGKFVGLYVLKENLKNGKCGNKHIYSICSALKNRLIIVLLLYRIVFFFYLKILIKYQITVFVTMLTAFKLKKWPTLSEAEKLCHSWIKTQWLKDIFKLKAKQI